MCTFNFKDTFRAYMTESMLFLFRSKINPGVSFKGEITEGAKTYFF